MNPDRPDRLALTDVPPKLVERFMNGTSDAISSMMEYSPTTTFHNVPVAPEEKMSIVTGIMAHYACVCKVNGREFPRGFGRKKKDARVSAAENALNALLGLDDERAQKGEAHADITPVCVMPHDPKFTCYCIRLEFYHIGRLGSSYS